MISKTVWFFTCYSFFIVTFLRWDYLEANAGDDSDDGGGDDGDEETDDE